MKTMKPQPHNVQGAMALFFTKEKLSQLTKLLDAIIDANSARYTRTLSLINERLKDFPPFMSVSEVDSLFDAMIEVTYELTQIIKNSAHANYFLDQDELRIYSAFKLIETIERELVQFERSS